MSQPVVLDRRTIRSSYQRTNGIPVNLQLPLLIDYGKRLRQSRTGESHYSPLYCREVF